MSTFVHLRLHSEYSIESGIMRIDAITKRAKNEGMAAIGISDLHNMFAYVKFYTSCLLQGIKPIIGCDARISNTDTDYRLLIIAKNNIGLKELNTLLTRSYLEPRNNYERPTIKEEWLFAHPSPNLLILSGGVFGDIAKLIISNSQQTTISDKLKKWQNAYGNNYYVELQRFSGAVEATTDNINKVLTQSLQLASALQIPVVATSPIEFAGSDDYLAHEVRVCIARGQHLDDTNRQSEFSQEQYFLSSQEMLQRFSDVPEAISNSIEIAKRCNIELNLGNSFLPRFAIPNDQPMHHYLKMLATTGLNERLISIEQELPNAVIDSKLYHQRLISEIDIIDKMGFIGYFLIVADFIQYARNNDIPVGPGRGSGAGSLVAFALGITDIDPMRHSLLFERFLNQERISMPDFDIDFCQDKRELVIDYVKRKYGANTVAQIATFGTMSSKAVLKDVGRTLGLPYGLCDSLSKLILNTPAKSYSLLEAYQQFPELKERIDNADDDVRRLWELSLTLEDLPRSVGKHAAGVLIAPSDLSDFCPLYLDEGGTPASQLDKDDVEKIGLVKFDFLGLRNLTIIAETKEIIKNLYNIDITLAKHRFDDEQVYKLLRDGNTCAIFQLESSGIRRILTMLEPDRFEDIIALLALYRPGPLGSGMVDDFIKRKKKEEQVEFFHPDLHECLEPTYGVIVYQEQVMQISQIIGGYTLGSADLLRRAMGKKKKEEMAKHKQTFIDGATKRGYKAELATLLFDLMAKFAEYGFNKSHSTAYAVISYHTAYLKTHYMSAFMAATLSSEMDKTDKLYEIYQDCLANSLVILPPNINTSLYRFMALDKTRISYALGAIKGIGKTVAQLIVKERQENGNFTSISNFCQRIDKKVLNKKSLESLVKAGAFDDLEINRALLLNNIPKILEHIAMNALYQNQGSLFGAHDASEDDEYCVSTDIALDNYPMFSLRARLNAEKQALGFYFSGSLYDEYKHIVSKLPLLPPSAYRLDNEQLLFKSNQADHNQKNGNKQIVTVGGIIGRIGSKLLKRGGKIYFISLEDDIGEVEFVIFDEDFKLYRDLLKQDEFVFIEGELVCDNFRNMLKINAKHVYDIDAGLRRYLNVIKHIELHIDKDFLSNELVNLLSATSANSQELSHGNNNCQSDNNAITNSALVDGDNDKQAMVKVFLIYRNKKAQCKINLNSHNKLVFNFANLCQLSNLGSKTYHNNLELIFLNNP